MSEAVYNPEMDEAYRIAKTYWSGSLSERDAVIESGVYSQSTAKNNWKKIWKSDNVQKAMENFRDNLPGWMMNKMPRVAKEQIDIALNSESDRERRQAGKYLMESIAGISKTNKLEVETRSKFSDMEIEDLLHYLEQYPGVHIDWDEFYAGSLDS